MQTVIGVRFKRAGKIYNFATGGIPVAAGDRIVALTVRGMELGEVVVPPQDKEPEEGAPPFRTIERLATEEDTERAERNHALEKDALAICEEKIAARGLPMKLVEAEYTFDGSRVTFYFTADGRVDFRELVKDLAAAFRTRIELRQIGVRDEAKMLGGIGCCGRPLCCATFLDDFVPVSIRMAKDQGLSLNPAKISGCCGRLMCCLKYENDCYLERQENQPEKKVSAPHPGCRAVTESGEGKVISINAQRRTATLLLDDGKTVVASWEDIIEKEEDFSDVAAMAAIAMIQAENEGQPTFIESERPGRTERHDRPKRPMKERDRSRDHDKPKNRRQDGEARGGRRKNRDEDGYRMRSRDRRQKARDRYDDGQD